jgi:hypothetical protein
VLAVATADIKHEMSESRSTTSACNRCGAPVHRTERPSHICEQAPILALAEIDAFDDELAAWLATPHGRFAVWLAERERAA